MKKADISDTDHEILKAIKINEMRENEEEIIHDALLAYLDSRRHWEMKARAWQARREKQE